MDGFGRNKFRLDHTVHRTVDHLRCKGVVACGIKTADRMHNMQTLREKGFEARYRKAIETETYYMPFFKECRSRYPRYESLFYAARSQISPLIFEIKSFYGEIQRLQWQLAEYQT